MKLELTDEQEMIRHTAESFSSNELAPQAGLIDREQKVPAEIVVKLNELGFMGMLVPEEYSGSSTGAVSYSLALMEIASGCASTAVTMAVTNMVAESIYRYGTKDQKNGYLKSFLSSHKAAGAFALTEPNAGSDARSIKTVARKKGDMYIINGSKIFITNGSIASIILVMALTDVEKKEITAFLVEPGFKGFSIGRKEQKMGLRGSDTVELIFDEMEVPERNILGKKGDGFRIAMGALDGGRIGIGSQCVGISRAAFHSALEYSMERKQFGVSIGNFGSIQAMVADSKTEIEAATLLTLRAAYLKDRGKNFTKEASVAKLFSSEMAYRVCNRAVQIFGGYGYSEDYPVERHLRDVKVTTIYEGTSEIQRLVISRGLMEI